MNSYLYEKVIHWIPKGSRVLDLGTGDGSFLKNLIQEKKVNAESVEQNPKLVASCIKHGLVTYQGDILDGLDQYGENRFDYVLLLGTLQELHSPEEVLQHSFRVARHVIVAFNNFAFWRSRLLLLCRGVSPSQGDDIPWYESPNTQFFSCIDFNKFCRLKKIKRLRSAYFNSYGYLKYFSNLRAETALTLLEQEK